MFQFVYAWKPGEPFDELANAGFVGVECDSELPDGIRRVGRRLVGGLPLAPSILEGVRGLGYAVIVPVARHGSPQRFAETFRHLQSQTDPAVQWMVENGGAFATTHELWDLVEAMHASVARISLNTDLAEAAGEGPAVLVPTLNLRVGSVRISTPSHRITDYARRLAGIGFDGYIICDPPASDHRPAAALELAACCRSVFPTKVTKKTAKTPATS